MGWNRSHRFPISARNSNGKTGLLLPVLVADTCCKTAKLAGARGVLRDSAYTIFQTRFVGEV